MTVEPVDELLAVEAIKKLRARLARLLDTKQWDEFGECFALDAVLEAPEADLRLEGRRAIVRGVSAGMAEVRSVHHLHAPEIGITGPDTAEGVWAMADRLERATDDGPAVTNGYGHYHETYTRGENGWRVQSFRLVRLRIEGTQL